MRHVILAGFLVTGVFLPWGCAGSDECPANTFDCGGMCYDLSGDHGNCGACGVACTEGQICQAGVCVLSCPEGMDVCDGTCRDLSTDTYNCGVCGMTCAAGYWCFDGTCEPSCPEGYDDCSGVCKNTGNDPSHCGECGSACAAGEVCISGSCSFTCPDPYVDCSGSCADFQTDHNHCGDCSTVCAAGEICVAGTCTTSCFEGLTMCSGVCVDLMRDPDNCSSCGSACDPGDFCYDGTCTASCPGGFTDCSGICKDLDSDRNNCGACDSACEDWQICESGGCTVSCASPLVNCSGMCSDTRYDPANCGSCGSPCAPGEACVDGLCETMVIGVTTSCKAIMDSGWSWGDGTYVIDPDGMGGAAPFSVYCDMTVDGGGWTLTYKINNDYPQCCTAWWDAVMPGSGTTFPTDLSVPSTYTEGPTLAARNSFYTTTSSTEWRAALRESSGAIVFDVKSSYTGTGGQALRCFATGTCTSATQTCSTAPTDGYVISNTLGGPISGGGSGYVCDVGWTGCTGCVDWSSVRTDSSAGGSSTAAIRYCGDDYIRLTTYTTYYYIR